MKPLRLTELDAYGEKAVFPENQTCETPTTKRLKQKQAEVEKEKRRLQNSQNQFSTPTRALMEQGIQSDRWCERTSRTKDGEFTYKVFDSYSLRKPENRKPYTSKRVIRENEGVL